MPRKDYTKIDAPTEVMLSLWGRRGDVRRYLTHVGFSEYAIRTAIENRADNGLGKILTKVGSSYLADPSKFVAWLEGYEAELEVEG